MANLNRERAQILLVTGLVLAVSFIALALVLNSVIYTENLATRGEEARGTEAIALQNDMVDGTERLIEYANAEELSDAEFEAAVGAMSNRTALERSRSGQVTSLTVDSVRGGTFVAQNDSTANFTSAGGAANWDLVDDADNTRSFVVDVSDHTGTFVVNVSDGNTAWNMTLRENAGDIDVELRNASGTESFTVGGEPRIDLTAGTVNGTEREAFQQMPFRDGVSSDYTISFEGADNVEGTFSFVTTGESVDTTNYEPQPDTPFVYQDAIYSADVHLSYESDALVYETDVRARPGESDD